MEFIFTLLRPELVLGLALIHREWQKGCADESQADTSRALNASCFVAFGILQIVHKQAQAGLFLEERTHGERLQSPQ